MQEKVGREEKAPAGCNGAAFKCKLLTPEWVRWPQSGFFLSGSLDFWLVFQVTFDNRYIWRWNTFLHFEFISVSANPRQHYRLTICLCFFFSLRRLQEGLKSGCKKFDEPLLIGKWSQLVFFSGLAIPHMDQPLDLHAQRITAQNHHRGAGEAVSLTLGHFSFAQFDWDKIASK